MFLSVCLPGRSKNKSGDMGDRCAVYRNVLCSALRRNNRLKNIEIREAMAKDAEALIEYMKIVGGETENLTFGETGLPITVEQEERFLESVYDDKTSVYLVACKDGEIVGGGGLNGLPRRMNHRAELNVSVKRKYWNCGIGSMLLKELIKYAKENRIEILNLEVRCDNTNAIHLYEKFGFKYIGTSPAFFKLEGEYVDFELMYLDLR